MEFYALTRKSNVVFFGENSMNKSFKVVFNKARGALMVVNEVTSSVQAKGTKTVIAAAVAALAASGAMATEWVKPPEELKTVQEEQKWEVLKEGSSFAFVLDDKAEKKQGAFLAARKEGLTFDKDLWVSGNTSDAEATGISAVKVTATNTGRIFVTSGENGKAWKNHGMLAENGGTAVNNGLIVAKNGYGMAVETAAPASTIINNDRIVVEDTGVGMELGGHDGSKGENHGTIAVGMPAEGEDSFTHGVLIKDSSDNTFTNYGTIEAAEGTTEAGKYATAIEIQKEDAQTVENNTLNFEAGSKVVGEVHIQDGVKGTVINANGFKGELDLNNESEELTINVKDGADLELLDGKDATASTISNVVIENGRLSASIWQSYAGGKDGKTKLADYAIKNVTVHEGGVFNVTKLNSVWDDPTTEVVESANKDAEKNQLLIKGDKDVGANWTLAGGALQEAGQNFIRHLKVGTSSDKGSFTIESGDYSYNSLTLGKAGTTTVNGGSLTVGHLTLSDGNTNNSALVYVGDNGSLTVNGTLSAKGTYTAQDDGKAGVYVTGDLTLGSNAKLDLGDKALTIDGELNAAQNQIFKATEGEDGTTTYTLAEGVDKIVFTDGAGLLLSDNVSMTQKDFTEFLQGLEGSWKGAAPDIVFTNVAFQGDVTFDTKLGYNAYATEVEAGEGAFDNKNTTTLKVDDDVAVGALKVDAGTDVVDLNHDADKKFVFAGLGGNVITGVDHVTTITSDGEVTLGWDETSKGVVNAKTLEANKLYVSGQFKAENVKVKSGTIEALGSLTLESLTQAEGAAAEDTFEVSQGATLEVSYLAINTTLDEGSTLVLGDRLPVNPNARAPEDDVQYSEQVATVVRTPNVDTIVTTNADGRNLLKAVAGDKYDATKNVGLYVHDTIAVNSTAGKLLIGTLESEDDKHFGDIALGSNSVTVIDVSEFSADKAIFVGNKLHVNQDSTILLKGADRIGSFKLIEGGTVNDVNVVNEVLSNGDTNAWLGYTVAQGTGDNAANTILSVAFDQDATGDEDLNAFAESVLTTGSESLGVVNAIGTVYRDEKTGKLSEVGEEALDEYMALPAVAGTYNAAYDAAEQVWNTIGAHNIDRTAGKTNGVWADVFYSANEAGDMYGNGYGYEADVYGGVLGYDYTAACGGKIGAALTIGTSDVDAKGDFIGDYGNDADFWGLSIYASKDITEKMIVSADITYLSLDNDIKGSVAGASVAESIDSSVISVGLRADWKAYESNAFEIVPHAGIRYAQIDVDDYREMDGESLDVLEMPIGVAFNGKFEAAGMKFVPTLDFTVVPQIGDTEVHPLNGDTLDVLNNTYNTTLGISAEYGDFTFGVAAKYGFGTDDRSNAGVKVNATYAF